MIGPYYGFEPFVALVQCPLYFLRINMAILQKSTLFFETSILWTVIFEALVLKKPLHRYSILALPLAFMGLVLVLDVTSFGGFKKAMHLH